MRRVNKRGFVLVETLVVTIFVLALFIFVYKNTVPVIGDYEKMYSYDDVDSVYATNLFKQVILKYANTDYIDEYLSKPENTYLNITDCNNNSIYFNQEYCTKMKETLSIKEDDYIFITDYNIEKFKKEVKNNIFFDSGKLSSFRDYLNTVADTDSFYNTTDMPNKVGKYRLFLTRTVKNLDGTTSLKYTNLGIYSGEYRRYDMGEFVQFDPGDGITRDFYVLKNSSSYEDTVTLIMASNLISSNIFASNNSNGPINVLMQLENKTTGWNRVIPFTDQDTFQLPGGSYTISYQDKKARLLDSNDIYTILGDRLGKELENIFSKNTFFYIPIDSFGLDWLFQGLEGENGYWMANAVFESQEMAWTIQKGKIDPEYIDLRNGNEIGIRPVIVVSKNQLNK